MTPWTALEQLSGHAGSGVLAAAVIGTLAGLVLVVMLFAGVSAGGFWLGRRVWRPRLDVALTGPKLAIAPARTRKPVFWLWMAVVVVGVVGLLIAGSGDAATPDFRSAIEIELSRFVADMSNGNSDIRWWTRALTTALIAVAILVEVGKFMSSGLDAVSHIRQLLMIFATVAIITFYDGFTQGIYGIGEGIAGGMQQALIGNKDTLFLGKWVTSLTNSVTLPEIGIFDVIGISVYFLLWTVTSLALQLVFWICSLWGLLTYSFAKMTGLVFVPFLIFPGTASFFNAWFRLFVGAVTLTIALKATGLVSIILIKACFTSIVNYTVPYSLDFQTIVLTTEQLGDLGSSLGMMVLSIIFPLAGFGFASALAGGVPDTSRALQSGVNKAASYLAAALL